MMHRSSDTLGKFAFVLAVVVMPGLGYRLGTPSSPDRCRWYAMPTR